MVSLQRSWPRESLHCGFSSKRDVSLQTRLQSCREKRAWQKALGLIGWACQARETLHETNFNSAGAACLQKNWMFALRLMRECAATASMNIGIAASNKAGNWPLGLVVLGTIQDSDLRADTISYNSAAGSVKWEMALWLTGLQAAAPSNEMDVVGLNAVVTAASDWCQVLSLLGKAPYMRLHVNIRCLTGALSVCERTTLWRQAVNVMNSVFNPSPNNVGFERSDIEPDKKSMSTLISACGKGFQWETAVLLSMVEMVQRSILPDSIIFCVAINACKDESDWAAALGIFKGLRRGSREGIRPTPDIASAYQATMSSCRLHWQLPLCMLQMMGAARVHKSGRLGDEACFNAAVSACDAGNMWRKAVEMSLAWHCNLIGMNSAISACSAPASRWEVALELQNLQVQRSLQIDAWLAWLALLLLESLFFCVQFFDSTCVFAELFQLLLCGNAKTGNSHTKWMDLRNLLANLDLYRFIPSPFLSISHQQSDNVRMRWAWIQC